MSAVQLTPGKRVCAFCLAATTSDTPLLHCAGCHRRSYCSKLCQIRDWKPNSAGQGHKNWCTLFTGEEGLDWEVRPISESKGVGVVARCALPAGFRVMVERGYTIDELRDAAFAAGSTITLHGLAATHLNQQKGVISHWDAARARWAVKLDGKEEATAVKSENIILSSVMDLMPRNGSPKEKWDLNSMWCTEAREEGVLCVRMSRLNHSCGANATHVYVAKAQVKILFTVQDIREGEEITIPYVNNDDIASTMTGNTCRQMLKEKWGITCLSDSPCFNKQKAALIQEGRKLDQLIPQLAQHPGGSKRAFHTAKQLLQIMDRLDFSPYHASRLRSSYDAFQVGIMRRQTVKEATEILRKQLEIVIEIEGPAGDRSTEWAAYVNKPSSHRNYLLG